MKRFTVEQRLRHKPDFQRLREHGRRVHCGAFILVGVRREEVEPGVPRLVVVTSRRVGKAVVRVRARRLMREIFRLNQARLPKDLDLMIIVRSTYTRETFQSLETRFQKGCRRLLQQLESHETPE